MTPKGTTTRTRTRNAETNAAYRQRKMENRDPPTGSVPCKICGMPVSPLGSGAHRRRHILDGDIAVELPHACACGEKFETERQLSDHHRRGHKHTAAPPGTKRKPERLAFVSSIANLPYREFVERLLEPWGR